MIDALHNLNYLHVIVVAIIGFAFGAVWYSMIFAKAWSAGMKRTPEDCEKGKAAMGPNMIQGFLWTLVSTFGLALLIVSHGTFGWRRGAAFGAVVGLLVVGARQLNSNVWDKKPCKVVAINLWHEVLLFALQGSIMAHWH